ncbi:MAG TPA: hypothetical protein VGF94_29410 [Kofleriaceae bacterium]
MGEAPFKPQIERPKPRLRIEFVAVLLLVMAAASVLLLVRMGDDITRQPIESHLHLEHCTPLDVEVYLAQSKLDPPDEVACYAVAGKIDRVRALLDQMPAEGRMVTVRAIFAIAHPIADAGDDASAGPIMLLVVDYDPSNYMAVFHAGMAEFALGHDDIARAQLARFLTMYTPKDVWRERAENALAAIAAHAPVSGRQAHFRE